MDTQHTQINHSDIFSSVESFLNFFRSKDIEGKEEKLHRSYSLPNWHPFYKKGQILAVNVDVLENGNVKMLLAMAVNPNIPFEVCLQNNWMFTESYEAAFEEICNYFVNGTMFAKEGGGSLEIMNGPKEFTWTFKEPKQALCEECQGKEVTENEQ